MTISSKSNPDLPRILVPQGLLTTSRPAIEWESAFFPQAARPAQANSAGGAEVQVQVQLRITADPSPESKALAEAGPLRVSAPRLEPGAVTLPAGRPVYLWLRERADATSEWSPWNPQAVPVLFQPLSPGPPCLWLYDLCPTRAMTPRRAFEEAHLFAALQGIVNRGGPRLLVNFMERDAWWLKELQREEGWLAQTRIEPAESIEQLIDFFQADIEGVVVWDREVNATSNLASTIAGVENLLPITVDSAPGSLWMRLVESGPRLPVRRDLRGMFTGRGTIPGSSTPSTGSAKCDAYVWAKEQFLDTGRCDAGFLCYYLDAWWIRDPAPGLDWSNHTLENHDYYISKRAFFWDLNVWEEERPVDDPGQAPGTDRRTLLAILHSAHRQMDAQKRGEMIRCGGFTPWAFKYTDCPGAGGSHGGVHTEWETVRILTQFNVVLDADALHLSGLANASVYQHFPLPEYLVQGPAPTRESLRRAGAMDARGEVLPKTFLLHYVGDYDSAAWVMSQVPGFWNAPDRGRTPLSWAINPNLAERAAPAFEYFYRTRTARDSFQAGDSGAGYVNPTGLLAPREISGLPPGGELWKRHCAEWYRRMNLTVTGFIINAFSGTMTPEAARLFAAFSGDGIVLRDNYADLHIDGHLPVIPMCNEGLPRDTAEAARLILEMAGPPLGEAKKPAFITCRSVLYGPDFYRELQERLAAARPGGGIVVLDPREFFYVARAFFGVENARRATWLFDTCPRKLKKGATAKFVIAVRNDGWDAWASSPDANKAPSKPVRLAIEFSAGGSRGNPIRIDLPHTAGAGDSLVIPCELPVPKKPGRYFLRAELVCAANDGQWFSDSGCLPLILPIEVIE